MSDTVPPDAALVVEIGSWLGRSTRFLADLAPRARIIAIDHWVGSPEHQTDAELVPLLPRLYETFLSECWDYRERIIPVRQKSVAGLKLVAEAGLTPEVIYIDALTYSQDLFGNWLIGGLANFNGGAGNHFDYSGSGTFGDSTFAGDITVDSGYQDSGYSYSGNGTLAMGSSGPFWSLTGTGKATGGNGSAFAMNGSGSYATSGSGWSMSGTRTGSDSRYNDYNYQVDYSLSGGVWQTTGGSGSGGAARRPSWITPAVGATRGRSMAAP